ncbi:MAG: hypothetical protein WBJ68_13170, partial [Candidatus Dechloromonas phosphoritropha]
AAIATCALNFAPCCLRFTLMFNVPFVRSALAYPTVRKTVTAASFPGAIIRDNTFCFSSFGYLTSSSSSPLLFWSEVQIRPKGQLS